MRVFSRFLYALLAVGVFLLTFQFSIMQMREKYYDDIFGASLVDETSNLPEFYYFYASLPDYHKREPLISIDQDGYQLRGYEIARTSIEEDTLIVEEAILFIIYNQDSNLLTLVDEIVISNDNPENNININLGRYHDLDILVSMDAQTSYYLVSKDLFDFSLNYTDISVMTSSHNVVLNDDFNITNEDFTIKENLDVYYDQYQELPTDGDLGLLDDSNIDIKEQVVTSNNYVVDTYLYLMGIYMGIYLILLIVTTYLIFFRKRKTREPY